VAPTAAVQPRLICVLEVEVTARFVGAAGAAAASASSGCDTIISRANTNMATPFDVDHTRPNRSTLFIVVPLFSCCEL
jgi:hypothetical protein